MRSRSSSFQSTDVVSAEQRRWAGRPRVLLVYRHYASSFVYYPWMLARGGLTVHVIATAGHPVERSRFVTRRFRAEPTDEAFYRLIANRLSTGEYALLLLLDEPARRLVHRGNDPACEPYLPIPRTSDLFAACSDKERFQEWCERHGVPTPATHVAAGPEHAVELAAAWRFTVVLKGAAGMGGKAVRLCESEAEVRAAYRVLAPAGNVLVQRFVSGAIGSCSFVALRGRMSAWTASEKYIALAGGLGPSAVRRFRTEAALGQLCAKIAAAGEITGITGFDWMEASPGEFLVIDPHFGRCTPPAAISHLAGVDVGRAVRDLLDNTRQVQEPRGHGNIVVMFPQFVELLWQNGFRTLWRRARPWAKGVRYFFGPREEARLSLRLAASYFLSGLKVALGRLKRRKKTAALKPAWAPSSAK